MEQFTQSASFTATNNPVFINPKQVDATEAVAFITKMIDAGEVIALSDGNGFVMFQSVDTLQACHQEWPAGSGRHSMSRVMTGNKSKNNPDKRLPVCNFNVHSLGENPLEGVIFGSIRMSINNLAPAGDEGTTAPEAPQPKTDDKGDKIPF